MLGIWMLVILVLYLFEIFHKEKFKIQERREKRKRVGGRQGWKEGGRGSQREREEKEKREKERKREESINQSNEPYKKHNQYFPQSLMKLRKFFLIVTSTEKDKTRLKKIKLEFGICSSEQNKHVVM